MFYKKAYNLREMENDWDEFAEKDPYCYIVRNENKKGNKWSKENFYSSGEKLIKNLISSLKKLDAEPKNNKVALDFGCAAGRLSEPLTKYFDKVIGVDISEKMIDLAKDSAEEKNIDNLEYVKSNNLSFIDDDSVDFIISRFVLEHIPPEHAKKYIKEFTRILAKGGLCSFEMLFEEPENAEEYREEREETPPSTMLYSIPKNEIYTIIEDENCDIVNTSECKTVAGKEFPTNFYLFKKN